MTEAIPPVPESSTPALLTTVVRRLTRRNVLDILPAESTAVRRAVTEWLLSLPADDVIQILRRGLDADERAQWGALQAMKHPELEVTASVRRRVLSLLSSNHDRVRQAAVQVIVRRWPEDAGCVLNEPICRHDHETLRTLCCADDPNLTLPLMQAFGFPRRTPPPTIGLLVSPSWLAEQHSLHTQEVDWLIRECGYCEGPVTSDVLEMLSLGLSLVVPQMTGTGPADQWIERVRTLSWRLLPDNNDLSVRDSMPVNLLDPIDTALFLAAVRDTDRLLFAAGRTGVPAELSRDHSQASAVCFHASARHVRRLFLTDAHSMSRELRIPDDLMGEFVVDHARCALESTPLTKIAADRMLRTAWFVRLASPTPNPASSRASSIRSSSERSDKDRGRAVAKSSKPVIPAFNPRRLVLGDFEPSPVDEQLSPCAQSICRLAELAKLDVSKIERRLAEVEASWARHVVPIGIELQIPKVDPNMFGAWKQGLPFLGIPSPHRPEFGGMLEAAFRPARSVHALLLAPLLLHRVGVISQSEPQDVAIHVSLQGDLDHQSRYLAFPQLFIHPSQRLKNLPDWAKTRVMSKGLVHCNREVERFDPLPGEPTGVDPVRTELRVFRVFCDSVGEETAISPTYVEDLVAVHLIGSALLSRCGQCRDVAEAWCRHLDAEMAARPPEYSRLLNSNFYESTGDPYDATLMQQLPIFGAWRAVRNLREKDQDSDLESVLLQLRGQHVQSLCAHLAQDHQLELSLDEFSSLASFS